MFVSLGRPPRGTRLTYCGLQNSRSKDLEIIPIATILGFIGQFATKEIIENAKLNCPVQNIWIAVF